MSKLRVRVFAEKICNRGSGFKGINEIINEEIEVETKDKDENGTPIKVKLPISRRIHKEVKTTSSDYIVFKCGSCDTRNRRCAYDAQVESGNNADGVSVLVFRCHKCYIMNEVMRPIKISTVDKNIVHSPTSLLGPDGRPIK